MKDEPRKQSGGGLSIKTLLIAGAASATAAFVVPMLWEPGTVFAAAMTPVIVAIVQELLRKPADTVSAVTTRRATGGGVILEPPPPEEREPFDPLAPASAEELAALPAETTTQRTSHRRSLTPRQWKLALVTGLIAFAGAVAFLTAGELLAGEQVGGGSNSTTFFSGSRRSTDHDAKSTPTATPQEREQATPSPTPTATATPTVSTTPTPSPTPVPGGAVPAPQATSPPATPTPAP